MKDWQHGYELAYLKGIESRFKAYNEIVLSPFAEMKKNKIASLLDNDKLDIHMDRWQESLIPTNVAKHDVYVKIHGSISLGVREKGERVIDNPVGDKDLLIKDILKYQENIWMMINSQYNLGNEIAKEMGFNKIGIKVNSFSDIINVYVKQNTDKKLNVFKIPKIETIHMKKIGKMSQEDVAEIGGRLLELHLPDLFANHYSKYNKSKSWSAISLRGFDQLPEMIEKPSAMNDKWQKENGDNDYFIQDTSLMKEFEPAIGRILAMLPTKIERVRLMKLEPNGGELGRHTDQADKYLGTQDGDIIRLHIPIFTNKDVLFHSWNSEGVEEVTHMGEGELWYLDIRKPHRAVNGGHTERVHLVIDVVANNNIRGMIEND